MVSTLVAASEEVTVPHAQSPQRLAAVIYEPKRASANQQLPQLVVAEAADVPGDRVETPEVPLRYL